MNDHIDDIEEMMNSTKAMRWRRTLHTKKTKVIRVQLLPERPRKTKVTFCMHGKRSRYIFRRGCKTKQTKPTESGIHIDVTQTTGQSHETGLQGLVSHFKHKNPNSIGHAPRKQIQTWHGLYVSLTRPAYRILSRWHWKASRKLTRGPMKAITRRLRIFYAA